jgi:hypothetical protein
MQFKTFILKCPSCSAPLNVSPDMERFACGHCGTEQIVLRRGGTVALKLVSEAVSRVQAGTDRTAAELAIRRLSDEIAALQVDQQRLLRTPKPLNYLRRRDIMVMSGVCVVLWFIANGRWEGALTFLFAAPVIFVIGFFAKNTPDPRKEKLAELARQIVVLTKKLEHNKSIVNS